MCKVTDNFNEAGREMRVKVSTLQSVIDACSDTSGEIGLPSITEMLFQSIAGCVKADAVRKVHFFLGMGKNLGVFFHPDMAENENILEAFTSAQFGYSQTSAKYWLGILEINYTNIESTHILENIEKVAEKVEEMQICVEDDRFYADAETDDHFLHPDVTKQMEKISRVIAEVASLTASSVSVTNNVQKI